VTVSLPASPRTQLIAIPAEAVRPNRQAWSVVDNSASSRPPVTGLTVQPAPPSSAKTSNKLENCLKMRLIVVNMHVSSRKRQSFG